MSYVVLHIRGNSEFRLIDTCVDSCCSFLAGNFPKLPLGFFFFPESSLAYEHLYHLKFHPWPKEYRYGEARFRGNTRKSHLWATSGYDSIPIMRIQTVLGESFGYVCPCNSVLAFSIKLLIYLLQPAQPKSFFPLFEKYAFPMTTRS